MPSITVEAFNARGIDSEELEELRGDLEGLHTDLDVRAFHIGQKSYEQYLDDAIFVWIPAGLAYASLLRKAVIWCRNHLAEPEPYKRPVRVTIVGPDGEALASVRVKDAFGEPEDVTADAKSQPSRQRPPMREQ